MAYLVAANFRTGTLTQATAGLALTTSEAPDADLTLAIARMSERVDSLTDDHFEPTSSQVLNLTGENTFGLQMPKRIRSITLVEVKQYGGTYLTQGSTLYVVTKSVGGATWDTVDTVHGEDRLDIEYGSWLTNGLNVWPCVHNGIRVTGTFDWPECPPAIQRAVALMVWDQFKPMSDIVRRADRYTTPDLSMSPGLPPTGIEEANRIVAEFSRKSGVMVR